MVEVHFQCRFPYTLVPPKWTYRLGLGLILMWKNLPQITRFAQERRGYGDTNSGLGLEYPTRPERVGYVRFWRWNWKVRGKIRTNKFYFPEADYLAALAALLRVHEKHEDAERIAAIMPLPAVELLPVPDPYDLANYSFNTYSPEIKHAHRLILEQRDFALAAKRAEAREGFTVPDGSGLSYLPDGSLLMHLAHGRTLAISEVFYLEFLYALRDAAKHARAYTPTEA